MKELILQNLSDKEYIYSGVYMIIFPNNKKYIGISNNIRRRMIEHNSDFRNDLPIENAIKKYGKIEKFILLEEIIAEDRQTMREREKYWISEYHSNIKEFGYNISEGGDGADMGSNNSQANFTEEQIQQIYKELKECKLTMTEIAVKYNIGLSSLSYINNGKAYFHSSEAYPIRYGYQKIKKGIQNCNSKFKEKDLDNIISLLKENNISMKEIALKYKVAESTIHNINKGKSYVRENEQYPLRISKIGSRKLTDLQLEEILFLLKNKPELRIYQIASLYNVSEKTISAINCGTIYKKEEEIYPIRRK